MVKQLEREGQGGETESGGETRREKHELKNWKQLSEKELSGMGTVARSRYQAVSIVKCGKCVLCVCVCVCVCVCSMSRYQRTC